MHAGTLALVLLLLAATAAGVVLVRNAVRAESRRLLGERTGEVAVVLNTAITQLSVGLQTLGQVARVTNDTPGPFATAAAATTTQAGVSDALLRPGPTGFTVVLATGGEFHPGQLVTGERAAVLRDALLGEAPVPTPVLGSGRDRRFGVALGPPAAPAGEVVYRESLLGPLGPPREASTAPFHDLEVVLYAGQRARPAEALVSTATSLPLTGTVDRQDVRIGRTPLLLTVSPVGPVVGSLAADSPWLLAAFGVLISALTGFVVEQASRRRDAALALYRTQRRQAEILQRSLLPELQDMAGLDAASRYLPGATEQRIGGDWFDCFPLPADPGGPAGRVAVVIGDVMGHDMRAAAAMAQVRAALRAYSCETDDPGSVLERLHRLVELLDVAPLVTVFYGVLDPPGPGGTRVLRYANAGHLPPLLRHPGGSVERLEGATSTLIGAPYDGPRPVERALVDPGATLVLFTDGLVETAGGDLGLALERLAGLLGEQPATIGAEELAAMLEERSAAPLRDDIAILVLQIPPGAAGHPAAPTGDSLPLACDRGAARLAREWVTTRLDGWDDDRVETARLLVSELTTNGVLHARTPLTVRAEVDGERLVVRVVDDSPVLPVVKRYGTAAETGRGFHLIDTMADGWGVEVLATGGKAVWFELRRHPSAARGDRPGAPGPDLAWVDFSAWDDDPAPATGGPGPIGDPSLPAGAPAVPAAAALAGAPVPGGPHAGAAAAIEPLGGEGAALQAPGEGVEVRIVGLPTRVYLLAAAHNDALLRELTLLPGDAPPAVEDPDAFLAATLRGQLGPATEPLRPQVDRAVAAGRETVDLVLRVPRDRVGEMEALAARLDEADRRCEDGAFLTLEAPELVRRFRHWITTEVAAQAAGRAPQPWPYGP